MGDDGRELRKLYKQREAIKSSVEGIKKYVEKFDPSHRSLKQIQVRVEKLITLITTYHEIQTEILIYDDAVEDVEGQLKFEDDTCTLRADMEDLITKHTVIENDNSIRASQTSSCDAVKLPTIQPPSFSGNLEDWSSFFDTFNALFHNNTSLTDVQRLHYLKSSVLGPASDIIKNFSITADNYKVAYDELIRHYENKGFTIQGHIRSLLQSPKVLIASAEELRKLHHHVASHVRALKALGQPVQHWDAWLVTLICGQLDASTAGEWQLRQDSKELPTYDQMESFLAKRVFAYEVGTGIPNKVSERSHRVKVQQFGSKVLFSHSTEAKTAKCPLCSATHKIYNCDVFKKMSVVDRNNTVSKLRLCFNCLNLGHQVKSCRYPGCPQCGKKHNSKLHEETPAQQETKDTNHRDQTTLYTVNASIPRMEDNLTVMLSTSIVHICDKSGQVQACRAVFDSGSQLNFMTKRCISKLGLSHCPSNLNIKGVDSMSSTLNQRVQATVASRFNSQKFEINLYAVPVIVQSLPSQPIQYPISIPKHIEEQLADPQFHVPGPIDILLGAEVFYELLGREKCVVSDHAMLYQTSFGWIVTGKLPVAHINVSMFTVANENVWSNSMVPESALSLLNSTNNVSRSDQIEEEMVEQHFQKTTTRSDNGQFIVRLPLKKHPACLQNTYIMAKKRFLNLERKLSGNNVLAKEYDECVMEYLTLGHMVPTSSKEENQQGCYLPHHAVIKSTSMTTKTRVVFDASAVGTAGLSLNDILMKGPTVQPTLYATLLRFRIHKVALTADIAKMYRQVLVHPEDCKLQKILYRSASTDALQEFTLQTVTFGTKTAPYLATKCLVQLGQTCDNPEISTIIQRDFYVDDLLTGADTEEQCYVIHCELTKVLESAHLMLRKWCSNSSSLLSRLPNKIDVNYLARMPEGESIGTLGMSWQPMTDSFKFMMKPWTPPQRMTKRTLLSDINSVYDPVGLVTPLLVKGKIFIQQLWCLKIDWDDNLSADFQVRWNQFYSSLQRLTELSVPRRAVAAKSSIQVHGFCDASQSAFGACLYLRSRSQDGQVHVNLFTSKSRVAPLKATTIPRLELCGALLLAELVTEAQAELQLMNINIPASDIYLWSDSTIVLAWIKSKCMFQVFVSNRIAQIQDLTNPEQWNHVSTSENPADLISRGVDVETMITAKLWWQGPKWLREEHNCWPSMSSLPAELPEMRQVKLILSTTQQDNSLFEKYSRWSPLVRVTGWILRFIHNIRCSKKANLNRRFGALTVIELETAQVVWYRYAQMHFSEELSALYKNKQVNGRSQLKSLNPFLDENGIIRVCGRLARAALPDKQKFPIILPPKHRLTRMIFEHEHERLLHVGPQALFANVRMRFWPLRGREIARSVVRGCKTCFKFHPKFDAPMMAPLPKERVTVEKPFNRSGVDFCGPISIKSGIRRVSAIKCYIAVFVCFVTRAVHLELVTDLTAEAFLAALSRFIARRGTCSHLYSDNATNFVGAHRILRQYFLRNKKNQQVVDLMANNGTQWHFIPPSAPHFGGLWEAAVKSAKHHMLKITKGALLSADEMHTLLCKIEAVLNSRPLTSLADDPGEYEALTPSHFLTGSNLLMPQEPEISTIPMNRLRRFQLMQAQFQRFWIRWSLEYLPQLQKRGRWTSLGRSIKVGDLAILKEDNTPPLQWKLVRIHELHSGLDGITRAVTVKLSSGAELKRPVVKLAVLPSTVDESESSHHPSN